MPTPNAGESQEDFVSRCIPVVLKDGTAESQEQAAAVCYSIYREKDKKSMSQENPEVKKKHFQSASLNEFNKQKLLSLTKDMDPDWGLGYASVEKPDSEGDNVKIDGMSWEGYHNPTADKHLTMLAGHAMSLDDGTPPIVGRVEQFYKTEYMLDNDNTTVPALAFSFSWAPSDLASKWKELYPKYLKSFSVGIMYNSKDTMPNPTGGMDINASRLYEISPVPVPANNDANAIKVIKAALQIKDSSDVMALVKDLGTEISTLKKVLETILQKTNDNAARYDVLESLMVSSTSNPPISGKKSQKKIETNSDLTKVAEELEKLLNFTRNK